jgi:hypothetical protein
MHIHVHTCRYDTHIRTCMYTSYILQVHSSHVWHMCVYACTNTRIVYTYVQIPLRIRTHNLYVVSCTNTCISRRLCIFYTGENSRIPTWKEINYKESRFVISHISTWTIPFPGTCTAFRRNNTHHLRRSLSWSIALMRNLLSMATLMARDARRSKQAVYL